jgi:ATP adenylyltransferase
MSASLLREPSVRNQRRSICPICAEIDGDSEADAYHRLLGETTYERRVIFETDGIAVLPSLGPLTDGHLLLCPLRHTRRFAGAVELSRDYEDVEDRARALLVDRVSSTIVSFEHGAARIGTVIPCTVDHAHVHLIALPAAGQILLPLHVPWREIDNNLEALSVEVGDDEYLTFVDVQGRRWVSTGPAGTFESQLLRKVVARAVGRPERWNWREDPAASTADKIFRDLAA